MFRALLPVDSSEERALRAAETIATVPHGPDDIHVTILNVQKKVDVNEAGRNVSSDEWYDEETFPESVEAARAVLEEADIPVETRREHADPSRAIVRVAEEIDADRIVMSGRKQSPVGKVLFGSVTQSVLLHAETAVTVAMDD